MIYFARAARSHKRECKRIEKVMNTLEGITILPWRYMDSSSSRDRERQKYNWKDSHNSSMLHNHFCLNTVFL